MRRIRVRGALLLILAVGGAAFAEEAVPRVVAVRIGVHPTFDRVVVELDGEPPLFRLPSTLPDEVLIAIRARRVEAPPELPPGLSRVRGLVLEDLSDGTRVHVRTRGPVRVFRLHGPPRLVVDVADPGRTPFDSPAGTEAVLAPPREAEEPAPGIPGEEVPPEEVPRSEPAPSAKAPPIESAPAPPHSPARPRAQRARPAPLPFPPPETPPGSLFPYSDRWLALAVWVGVPLLLAGLGLWLLRRRAPAAGGEAEIRTPETITPDEVLRASDRIDLLEKRIDEEVRARMQVEQRLGQIQEDMKVVRDRIVRLVRRGEPAA